MNDHKKRVEPKKIKMPPLVDRSMWYDTMSWCESDSETDHKNSDENNSQNNSQGISELESM